MHRQLQTPELECLAWNIFLHVGDHILKKNFFKSIQHLKGRRSQLPRIIKIQEVSLSGINDNPTYSKPKPNQKAYSIQKAKKVQEATLPQVKIISWGANWKASVSLNWKEMDVLKLIVLTWGLSEFLATFGFLFLKLNYLPPFLVFILYYQLSSRFIWFVFFLLFYLSPYHSQIISFETYDSFNQVHLSNHHLPFTDFISSSFISSVDTSSKHVRRNELL